MSCIVEKCRQHCNLYILGKDTRECANRRAEFEIAKTARSFEISSSWVVGREENTV